ncbi:hypothetical protein [Halococcus sp. AFM35]|uniref:hypothetical protein n=1 Tax=Halococcus sp. AFM35 TaxID=3421653 RepID=UPI003EBDFCF1
MSDDSERMAETAAKLDSALEDTEESADSTGNGTDADDELAALLGRVETDVESLLGVLSGDESFEEAKDDIEDLVDVIEETDELLETVAVSELPDAVELRELPSVIEGENVPEAIANAEPERAIDLTRLASLVEFSELWDAVDVRAFMQNKEELEAAADDVTDEDGDGEGSGLLESSAPDDSAADGETLGESLLEQDEAKQAAIQSQLSDAVEEFRESALDARDQLQEARDTAQEEVEAKTGGGTGQPTSRNPTAYSTMVGGWNSAGWSSSNFSTVPQSTQHSSAPGHFRIYGRRFDEREGDDE